MSFERGLKKNKPFLAQEPVLAKAGNDNPGGTLGAYFTPNSRYSTSNFGG